MKQRKNTGKEAIRRQIAPQKKKKIDEKNKKSEKDEEWVDIPTLPGYQISNKARIRAKTRVIMNKGRAHIRKASYCRYHKGKGGYMFARLSVKGVVKKHYIHRLMMMAFVGPIPEGKEVDHINRIRDDNRIENLRYVTKQEQNANRVLNPSLGEDCNFSKLTEKQVREIRSISPPYNFPLMSKKYGVKEATIKRVINRENLETYIK